MIVLALWILACAGAPAADSGCATAVTWDNFADGFFASYCRSCHSATATERHGAPPGLDLDAEGEVRALEGAVRRTVLEAASMPPGGGVVDDDRALLEQWLDCAD